MSGRGRSPRLKETARMSTGGMTAARRLEWRRRALDFLEEAARRAVVATPPAAEAPPAPMAEVSRT